MQEAVDIGGVFGRKVPALGFANGLLVAGVRWLALALCASVDLRKFQNYRRKLLRGEEGFDFAFERKLWGCTHPQIASLLLLSMGFPAVYAELFEVALAAAPRAEVPTRINRLRILAQWTFALQTGINPPTMPGENEFLTSDLALDQIAKESSEIGDRGSRYSWLFKSSDDVTKEAAAKLAGFEEAKALLKRRRRGADVVRPAVEGDDDFRIEHKDLPDHIRRHFPQGEFEDLKGQIHELLSSK